MGKADRVSRRFDSAGAWEMASAPPPPSLRGLVHEYVGFVETSATPLRRRETPSSLVTLIINLGTPLSVTPLGAEPTAHDSSFIARISSLPAVTEFVGTSAGIQVDMTPLGAHMLLDLAMDELPEPSANLDELLGLDAALLTEQLAGISAWEERFERLDRFILRRLEAARDPSPSVTWAWRALLTSGGRVEIGALTDRLGCSRRHLIAGFRDQVGVPPKTAAAIIRFARAASLLRRGGDVSLAEVAFASGYHDQSHMSRDFRRFGGTTPAVYAGAWHSSFPGVPEDVINSVQDRMGVRA